MRVKKEPKGTSILAHHINQNIRNYGNRDFCEISGTLILGINFAESTDCNLFFTKAEFTFNDFIADSAPCSEICDFKRV